MRKWISSKQAILEQEKVYLEKQFQEGWEMVSKGLFFYKFNPIPPKEVVVEIDLIPHDTPVETLPISGWQLLMTQKLTNKKYRKVYYVSEDLDARLTVDEKWRADYYQSRAFDWALVSMIGVGLFLAMTVFNLAEFLRPLLILSAIGPFLTVYGIWRSTIFEKALKNLQPTFREEAAVVYTVAFATPPTADNLDEVLALLGKPRKVSHKYWKLKSELNKDQIRDEISANTGIDAATITVLHPMDNYFIRG